MPRETGPLRKLARLYGIQTAYYGRDHTPVIAPIDSLLAVLQSLSVPVDSINDITSAIRQREIELWKRPLEPVVVAWDGHLESLPVRLPQSGLTDAIIVTLNFEDGTSMPFRFPLRGLRNIKPIEVDREKYIQAELPLTLNLPPGYHRVILECGRIHAGASVISAPARTYLPDDYTHQWGVFLPLYALRSDNDWGTGDYTGLARLADWVGRKGGTTVASLPLLDSFLDNPYEHGPYLPASKLFWNEFYLDVTRAPEYETCTGAKILADSMAFRELLGKQRQSQLVDYRGVMAMKKRVLEEMSRHFFTSMPPHAEPYQQFLKNNSFLESYARFRAVGEEQGKPWTQWPARFRAGELKSGDCSPAKEQYHRYVQWLAHCQLSETSQVAARRGVRLYLDLPIGTHPQSYDTWRFPDIFINKVSAGAPPDTVFTRGQNWNFPSLHPEAIRATGYRYAIECLRNHLQYAKILRIDHMMGFHRLFIIPRGSESRHGVYLRYRPEEMYAILCLESHRHKSIIVGEDLGIVPRKVRTSMKEHGLQKMYVMYYELATDAPDLLPTPAPDCVASLSTHDMPPFASFWSEKDIRDRRKVGIINAITARKERDHRRLTKQKLAMFLHKRGLLPRNRDVLSVLKGCLSFLAASPARLLLINLEDLWLETHTQNIPSTTFEYPNWRQKAKYDFETFCKLPEVVAILKGINQVRKARKQ